MRFRTRVSIQVPRSRVSCRVARLLRDRCASKNSCDDHFGPLSGTGFSSTAASAGRSPVVVGIQRRRPPAAVSRIFARPQRRPAAIPAAAPAAAAAPGFKCKSTPKLTTSNRSSPFFVEISHDKRIARHGAGIQPIARAAPPSRARCAAAAADPDADAYTRRAAAAPQVSACSAEMWPDRPDPAAGPRISGSASDGNCARNFFRPSFILFDRAPWARPGKSKTGVEAANSCP